MNCAAGWFGARVERFLRPGQNLIALSVTAPQTGEIAAAGMAWNLRLILAPLPPLPSLLKLLNLFLPWRFFRWPLFAGCLFEPFRSCARFLSRSACRMAAIPGAEAVRGAEWVCAQSIELTNTHLLLVRESGAEMEWPRPAVRWIEFWPTNAAKGGVSSMMAAPAVSSADSSLAPLPPLPLLFCLLFILQRFPACFFPGLFFLVRDFGG